MISSLIFFFPHYAGQRSRIFFFKYAIPALRNSFESQRSKRNAFHFLQRMSLAKQSSSERFHLRVAHFHFVPIIRGMTAARPRLPQCFHFHTGFLSEPFQIGERQHSFDFYIESLLKIAPAL